MIPVRRNTLPFVVLIGALLGGCAAPAPAELKFRCVLPKMALVGVDPDLAAAFASRLAAGARLQVLSQTRFKGKASNDVTYIVSLRSAPAATVFVNIAYNEPYRTVALTISGDVRNPEATRIAQESARAFSALFPGSALAPFSGDQALFGP